MVLILALAAINLPRLENLTYTRISSASQTIAITTNTTSVPRWNHFPLTIYIENTPYSADVAKAMDNWNAATGGLVTFQQVSSINADITFMWVDSLNIGSSDATGDTDLRYIDTGSYKIISNAHIQLLANYQGFQLSDIDMTNIAEHELGHSLGLEHSKTPGDIMYPTLDVPSLSVIQISPNYAQFLGQIYQTPPEPDLTFSGQVQVSKFSAFLHYYFNATFAVKNIGITASPGTAIYVYSGNDTVDQVSLPPLDPGSSYNITLSNIMSESNFNSVKFVINPQNAFAELNMTNNIVTVQLI